MIGSYALFEHQHEQVTFPPCYQEVVSPFVWSNVEISEDLVSFKTRSLACHVTQRRVKGREVENRGRLLEQQVLSNRSTAEQVDNTVLGG